MNSQMTLGDIDVEIVLKDIKNLHLRVYPPAGRVRISAPKRMRLEVIRAFAIAKLGWIKRQQARLRSQQQAIAAEATGQESRYVWGKRYLFSVSESAGRPSLAFGERLGQDCMLLQVRPGTPADKRRAIEEAWYRDRLKEAVPPLLAKWQPVMGVAVERFFVRRMKTLWGSCNHKAHTIRLNSELAKRPAELLEYVVVHELVHLLEPSHNARFVTLMDRFLPEWQAHRQELNRQPIRR
jgi:predicted metal-dependent hydrolase